MSTKQALKMEDTDRLWTARDVARYLQASESWVRKASADGRLPCRRIGAMVRFDPAVIRAWATGQPAKVVPLRR